MGAFVDIAGQRFGRLLVVERAPNQRGPVHWLCRCDCGNETVVASVNIRTGNTRSCGCLHAESARKNGRTTMLTNGEAAFRALLGHYKRNARNRGIEFKLSREEFKALTQQDCYYCGSMPQSIMRGATYSGDYVYNGVDRIDNALGYIPDNCVPCCKFCNLAKAGGMHEEFTAYLDRVVAFRGKRP